jgi:hypothetical protein
MQTVTTIGLDIAKSVFQVHGIDAAGMRQHGLLRSLKAAELSHGTLRYCGHARRPDDLERTRNKPPSGFARPAGAAYCRCGVAIVDFCRHPCWPARRILVRGSRLPVVCAWEGAWRDRDGGRRAPQLDLADEVIVPTARGEQRTSTPFIRSRIYQLE